MSNDSDTPSKHVTATAELSISGYSLKVQMSIPTAPTRPVKLLPLFQSLADAVIGIAVKTVEEEGLKISCKKGCGACCRQLVPISAIEARRLRDLVNDMPEPRRSEIRARFDAASSRLQESGLLEKLRRPERILKEEAQAFGLEYFYQGIACPFLEEESCSIHPDRPIACREYLVTSPAENCAKPTSETVKCVKMPAKVSGVIGRIDGQSTHGAALWVPLILALEWADAHPDEAPLRPGTELVREVFSRLTGQEVEEVES